jgi:hypothetical protein
MAVTGGVPDPATTLLKISSDQFSNLQSLFFNIGGVRQYSSLLKAFGKILIVSYFISDFI